MATFIPDDVIQGARERYQGELCLDFLDEAMECETLEGAIELVMFDSDMVNA